MSKKRIKSVKYNPDIKKVYASAIAQNKNKRNRVSVDSKEYKIYTNNIEKLKKELDEINKEPVKIENRRKKIIEAIRKNKKILEEREVNKDETEPKEINYHKETTIKTLTETKKQREKEERNEKINDQIDRLIREDLKKVEASYRGNKYLNKQYDEAMKRYKNNIIEKSYKEKINGKTVRGRYKTVRDYQGKEKDERILGFQDYKETLERFTKAKSLLEKGINPYKNSENNYYEDKKYLKTNNYRYNQYTQTRKNLKTLGYFGKKSKYLELKQGQYIRNTLRAGINITGYVRNHTIVPVSNFIGEKAAVKVYDVAHNKIFKNKNGAYKNRRTHRYEARKQYHLSQGKGYIKSVYHSIRYARKTDNEIIENKKQEIREIYENYRRDLLDQDKRNIRRPKIQVDPISEDIHEKANLKNVTRVITGIKTAAIAGISYLGPKISKVILDKTSHERIIVTETTGADKLVQTQKLVEGKTYQVIDREKLENLTVSDFIDLQDNKVASYAGGAEETILNGNLEYIRGIAENSISMGDKNIKNITEIANGRVPTEFLNSAGNINGDTKIIDLIVSNRNQSSYKNITKEEILGEIFNKGSVEEKMQKIQEMFDNVYILKGTSAKGKKMGWDSLGDEFERIKQSLYITAKEPTKWKTVTTRVKGEIVQEISKGRENSKIVQGILKGAGNSMRAIRIAEVIDLIYENSREKAKGYER